MGTSHSTIIGQLKITNLFYQKFVNLSQIIRGALKAEIIPIEPGTGNAV